jgi:hypothetical protein
MRVHSRPAVGLCTAERKETWQSEKQEAPLHTSPELNTFS